ncbi:hypothetical protein [Mesorhizobium sp. ZC-5]|uniref:hypothetical protein n=1 Tax=Mesorhizobium sp. ZC-5 TaxID=2986066 RepID=UPI0021E8A650|nr:hypothetical protein [Mesorhizobium sp. ZC-5]MCV3243455.1 hypothetical protein [Mesorhizobium sp. ZC-5]
MEKQRSVCVFNGDEFALALQAGMEPTEKHRPAKKTAERMRIAGKGKPVKLGAIGKRIQKAIAKTMTPTKKASPSDMVVAVFKSENPLVRKTVRDIMERVPSIVEARQKQLTDDKIDALVSVYMPSPPDTDATQILLDSNARARARFLEAWPCLTSKQVSEAAGHGSKNQSMTTSRWKGGGKIFSVRYNGAEWFPAFQFQDGQPHATVARVLQHLRERKSGWQMAFWFTSPNGWLNGRKPAECLDDVESVARAAAEEAEPIIG